MVATKKQGAENVTLVRKIRDYSKDPVFKKKAREAIAFLAEHPLPRVDRKKK